MHTFLIGHAFASASNLAEDHSYKQASSRQWCTLMDVRNLIASASEQHLADGWCNDHGISAL